MSTEKTEGGADGGQDEGLRALVAACEARLTEIADLVAHVRHEINNPLTGVIGQAQLLLREELSQSARRRVETIEQLAGRIRDTVAELRAVQRPPQPQNQDDGPAAEETYTRPAREPPHFPLFFFSSTSSSTFIPVTPSRAVIRALYFSFLACKL